MPPKRRLGELYVDTINRTSVKKFRFDTSARDMLKSNQPIDRDYHVPPAQHFDFSDDRFGIIDPERTIAHLVYKFTERDFMNKYRLKQSMQPDPWVYREPNTFFTTHAYVAYLQEKKRYNEDMFKYYQQKQVVEDASDLIKSSFQWMLATEGIEICEDELTANLDQEDSLDELSYSFA